MFFLSNYFSFEASIELFYTFYDFLSQFVKFLKSSNSYSFDIFYLL